MPPLTALNANTIFARPLLSGVNVLSKSSSSHAVEPENIYIPGEETDDVQYDMTCNQIRAKINQFLNSGEMKVTEFQKHLGVNSNSYGRFMKLGKTGPWSGIDNGTFHAAYLFFKKRELAGVKTPKKNVNVPKEVIDKYDVSGIRLPGERTEEVEIYDTCDDVRSKVNKHLREAPVTKAGFMREICKTFPEPKTIQAAQLQRFLKGKGPTDGQSSPVFYAGYVYFEKLRIKNGGKKTTKRQEMEALYLGEGGMSRELRRGGWVTTSSAARVTSDQYGRTIVHDPMLGDRQGRARGAKTSKARELARQERKAASIVRPAFGASSMDLYAAPAGFTADPRNMLAGPNGTRGFGRFDPQTGRWSHYA